jgi:hypothetical protein
MSYLVDTCGELETISVSADINGSVNNPELYFHFFAHKKLFKKD